jgi:hypothetical protein
MSPARCGVSMRASPPMPQALAAASTPRKTLAPFGDDRSEGVEGKFFV